MDAIAARSYSPPTSSGKFNVGGIELDQPFKIRRLGHFGFNVDRLEESLEFYRDILGFDVADIIDFSARLSPEQMAKVKGPPLGIFMRYGTDHHSFVLFNASVRRNADTSGRWKEGVTTNQITWQLSTLGEVNAAINWFGEKQVPIVRSGRDMPGSNWHTYIPDPYGHVNELYYGIEQVGWNGRSKPRIMHERGFREPPPLPQISEFQEIDDAVEAGVDLLSGHRHEGRLEATYDVDGVMLPRPFKIVRIGPVRLFAEDVAEAEEFYRDILGFTVTEEVTYDGQRCVFMRANTEHHVMALYPLDLRKKLGLSGHSTNMSFGVQLANYRQLRAARDFLAEKGIKTVELPPELHPGIDYAVHAQDPDGHCIELYYQMEHVGWDGKPRPADQRRKVTPGVWPQSLPAMSDSYMGETLLGPLG